MIASRGRSAVYGLLCDIAMNSGGSGSGTVCWTDGYRRTPDKIRKYVGSHLIGYRKTMCSESAAKYRLSVERSWLNPKLRRLSFRCSVDDVPVSRATREAPPVLLLLQEINRRVPNLRCSPVCNVVPKPAGVGRRRSSVHFVRPLS